MWADSKLQSKAAVAAVKALGQAAAWPMHLSAICIITSVYGADHTAGLLSLQPGCVPASYTLPHDVTISSCAPLQ